MKMIEVVAAIIERDGKILLAQRPAQSDQAGLWEFAGGKVEPDESQRQALVRELREELGIEATVGEYVASHQREVSGRIIHLHAWHVPDFHGTLQAHEHQALVWCSPEEALQYPLAPADIPLLEAWLYAPPDQRISAKGFVITLALQQYSFGFNYRPFRIILILINAALSTGLR
ncbi:TPA: pyrimidine (deoxy)nucleoside triphosphate diphosphatase [Escherichia coli]|nr:pyrimidine (deoxy)nucleoside triphosphate diphosphatase [Escherichia coli]